MSVENNRLKEENNKINVENCNLSSEIENLKQQSDKYKQYKVENKDYLSKLTEQINTLNQNKIEIDNLKLMKEKEAMDIENKYNVSKIYIPIIYYKYLNLIHSFT